MNVNNNNYDFIIVGAGSAGCLLAARLSENPAHQVLLIEAGPEDKSLYIHMPKGIGKLLTDPAHSYFYPTEPEVGNGNRTEYWVRGKTLGGSSSVNGMMYNRGQPEDYDELEKLGCKGWNWKSILPHFRKIEDHELGASELRGTGGPLKISLPEAKDPLYEAMIESGRKLGLTPRQDMNGPVPAGIGGSIGYFPRTIWKGRRWSSARAFLTPSRQRSNLTVLTGTQVERVIFEGTCARGVQCLGSHAGSYFASREVILSAGAIVSPQLLMLSGVGSAAALQEQGIALVHDNPNVGQHMREHRVLSMQFRLSKPISHNKQYHGLRMYWNGLKYLLTHRGVMAAGAYEVGAFARTQPEEVRPDAQLLLAPYTFDVSGEKLAFEKDNGMAALAFILRPDSEGSISLRSANPQDPPLIRPNYLATEHDRQAAIRLVRYIRRFVSSAPLADFVVEETLPGSAFATDEQIIEAWNSMGTCGFHAIGTCKMGGSDDDTAVVDERLRVRGVERLRVVDCSVLPIMVAGNTNGPIMAVASRAAELILEEA